MEFESDDWDVGQEAQDLDRSLFQDKNDNIQKSKNKKHKKRKMVDGTDLVHAKMTEQKEKVPLIKVSKLVVTEQMSDSSTSGLTRKERRQLIWEEKMRKKKSKAQMGNQEKPAGINSVQDDNDADKTRINTLHKNGKTQSEAETCSRKSKVQNSERFTNDTVSFKSNGSRELEVQSASSLSKKERRNLRRKQKKLEKNLADRSNEGVASADKNENVYHIDRGVGSSEIPFLGVFKSHKNEVNGQEELILKHKFGTGTSHSKRNHDSFTSDHSDSKSDKNEMYVSESKKMKMDLENSPSDKIGSPVSKKKRKRKCKKNKFKGYVKEVNTEPTVVQDNVEKRESKQNELNPDQKQADLNDNLANFNADMSLESAKQKKKKKRKKSDTDFQLGTSNVRKAESTSATVGSNRHSLDPKVLSGLLKSKYGADWESKQHLSVADTDENVVIDSKQQKKTLLEKSWERLNAARFRYLNEQLYTTTGEEALKMFQKDERAFQVYHEGFQGQVEKWPTNPVDIIIEQIKAKPKHLVIADLGCGDAKLARSVPNIVHSYDLVALNDSVTVCDMAKVPLQSGVVDIAVFCLSLMGTNLSSYIKEASRVLKNNGTLLIAEVMSRFNSIGSFILQIEKMGFKIKQQDTKNKMFVMMEFKKTSTLKDSSQEDLHLKPCVYKKR